MDHVHDKSLVDLAVINATYRVPAFVKTATVTHLEDVERIPSTSFALPARRLFPVHTPQDTWMSAAYFQKNAGSLESPERVQAATKILDALQFWGIKDSFEQHPVEKEAGAPLTIRYEIDGEVKSTVDVRTPQDLEKVAHDLVQNRDRYPFPMRLSAARQVLEAPAELRATLQHDTIAGLQKTAGHQIASHRDVVHQLKVRKAWYDRMQQDTSEYFDDLLKEASDAAVVANGQAFLPPSFLMKAAGIVDYMDRFAGLHSRYGQDLAAPEDMFNGFSLREAQAAKEATIQLQNGHRLHKTDVVKKQSEVQRFLENVCNEKAASFRDVVQALERISSREADIVQQIFKG